MMTKAVIDNKLPENVIDAGKDDIPSEKSLAELDSKSDKFAKLRSEVEA